MFCNHPTSRWLITASLIVSLGVTGLFPQMIVWADSGTHASALQSTNCCCGTEDGRCCGMGCCVAREAPAKEPSPCPAKDDNGRGRTHPLAIGFAKAIIGSGDDASVALIGRPSSDADRSLAESSLQSKHVRLDA